jgi:hypothetical protein
LGAFLQVSKCLEFEKLRRTFNVGAARRLAKYVELIETEESPCGYSRLREQNWAKLPLREVSCAE